MVVTSDITGSYQYIPHEDGSESLGEALKKRIYKYIPTSF